MIDTTVFGHIDGKPVTAYHLHAGNYRATILDYGGIIRSLTVPTAHGDTADVCLGYDDLAAYRNNAGYLGALIGRVANRIAHGRFTLGGREYVLAINDNGVNTLHGGKVGFNARIWKADRQGDSLRLSLVSPDGDEGFPGRLETTVVYTLTEDGALRIEYTARTDRDTPCNLTNHIYFNLNGEGSGDVLGHSLQLDCARYTPVSPVGIPLGTHEPVAGTPFDFRTAKPIGREIDSDAEQLRNVGGYDHSFCIDGADGSLRRFAVAIGDRSGVRLEGFTTQPAVQLYTGNFLDGVRGKSALYTRRTGFCLETQVPPDCVRQPALGDCILRAGKTYRHTTVYRFSTVKD